jgi:FixJ family two-component response regulator
MHETTGRPVKQQEPVVFVIDDDEAMREALSSLIRSVGLQVETFASAADWQARFPQPPQAPACLVLDVRMPGISGLDLQQELVQLGLPWPIIFITGHGDIPMTVRAMKAGAVEFLPKPFRDQDLLDAISTALEQARSAQGALLETQALRARYATLTAREREVLGLMVIGLRNKQTADRLGIGEGTVKVHRHHLMEKMRARSLPALVAMAQRLGLEIEARKGCIGAPDFSNGATG